MISRSGLFLVGLSLVAGISQASTIYYVNWTSDTPSTGSTNGSAAGTIAAPQGTINVSYSGDVVASTQINNVGTDYYTGSPSVYTNATVSNSPTNVDVIALSEAFAYTDTLTFSVAVTNPILDIVSLGNPLNPVSYIFSATPVILSQGPGWFAGGCSTCLSVSGNTLTGTEGDGIIEFVGSFTSISWTTTGTEDFNGITAGVADASGVPEPATWSGLLIVSLLAIPFVRRHKARPTA